MSNIIKTALLMGGLLWQSTGLASDTGWLTSPRNDHAQVRLQADTRDPAHTRVLLSLELESGWKTYWQNPGEGGIAPEIFWDDPQLIQQWHWPVPERFDVSGISTQGYQKAVSLPISLTHGQGVDRHATPFDLQQRLHPDGLLLYPPIGWLCARRV